MTMPEQVPPTEEQVRASMFPIVVVMVRGVIASFARQLTPRQCGKAIAYTVGRCLSGMVAGHTLVEIFSVRIDWIAAFEEGVRSISAAERLIAKPPADGAAGGAHERIAEGNGQ